MGLAFMEARGLIVRTLVPPPPPPPSASVNVPMKGKGVCAIVSYEYEVLISRSFIYTRPQR